MSGSASRYCRLFALPLACALALPVTGCGTGPSGDIRIPTRPDGVNDSNDSTNVSPDAPDGQAYELCVGQTLPVGRERTEMFARLNAYRVENGLSSLAYSGTLQEAANGYAYRLYNEDFFDHVAPDGSEPGDRAVAAGFCHRFVGENLAMGTNILSTAAEAMHGFENSPDHNENMLRPQWDFVGIGFLHITDFEGDHYWWVQMFASDLGSN